MNPAGDAAEQIVRMSLNGVEVAAKITGAGAKHLAGIAKCGTWHSSDGMVHTFCGCLSGDNRKKHHYHISICVVYAIMKSETVKRGRYFAEPVKKRFSFPQCYHA